MLSRFIAGFQGEEGWEEESAAHPSGARVKSIGTALFSQTVFNGIDHDIQLNRIIKLLTKYDNEMFVSSHITPFSTGMRQFLSTHCSVGL